MDRRLIYSFNFTARFLFENEKRTVLYSGDCRLEPKFVDTIIDKIPKTIDTLYLDCTFLDEKLWTHFPLMVKRRFFRAHQ